MTTIKLIAKSDKFIQDHVLALEGVLRTFLDPTHVLAFRPGRGGLLLAYIPTQEFLVNLFDYRETPIIEVYASSCEPTFVSDLGPDNVLYSIEAEFVLEARVHGRLVSYSSSKVELTWGWNGKTWRCITIAPKSRK
jgi:hypothetical protein